MPEHDSTPTKTSPPRLTKVEYIEYQWLLSRGERADQQQLAKLSELEDKLRETSKLTGEVRASATDSNVVKIGELIVRYVEETVQTAKPTRRSKIRKLVNVLFRKRW